MNVDYNKHNIVKYLANNKDKDIWKMSVSSIGFQSTKFLDSYPPKGHPFGYTFNPERGRILDEFSLIYITKGRGTFQSGNCSEKKITKGDVFLLFPREWHTYRPAKDIGWNEYFVDVTTLYQSMQNHMQLQNEYQKVMAQLYKFKL